MENKNINQMLLKAAKRTRCSRPRKLLNNAGLVMYVRCQSRKYSECPACATLYATDQKRLIGSGCNPSERDEITAEMLSPYKFYFVTLTAPSFGAIHRVPRKPDAQEIACVCKKTHKFRSEVRGTPVNERWYKYREQINWNHASSELFRRTIRYTEELLPGFDWAFTREWQIRGALHFHGIIRVPREFDDVKVFEALQKMRTYKYDRFGWGKEVDVAGIKDDSTGNSVRYMSKVVSYTAKQQGDVGVISDTRMKFYDRLDWHAARVICGRAGCKGDESCEGATHRSFGYAGQMSTRSKGWSLAGLTQSSLVDERKAFAIRNKGNSSNQESLEVLSRAWDDERRDKFKKITTYEIDSILDEEMKDFLFREIDPESPSS